MKKILSVKKVKFAMLFAMVSIMAIQAGQAYKLYCPVTSCMAVKLIGNQYEYFAQTESNEHINDRNIMMKNIYDKKLDLSSFSFVAASSSSDNRLFCSYADHNGEILNLVGLLKKGNSCIVTYPKGHENPESSYFECRDLKNLSPLVPSQTLTLM